MNDADVESMAKTGFRLSPPQLYAWSHYPNQWVQCRISLTGVVPSASIARALHTVIGRHESLRSSLLLVPGLATPLQAVDQVNPLEWFEDVLPEEAVAAATAVDLAAAADRARPFAGSGTGAVRARLLSAPDRAVLVLTLPGMFVDRRSLCVIFDELAAVLDGSASGEEPLQYLDAAEWLDEQLRTDEANARMEAWREREFAVARELRIQLEGETTTGAGAARVPLDPTATHGVALAAEQAGCSAAALLLGAWQVLVRRLTANEQVVTALIPTSRGLNELDEVVGLIASPVPALAALPPSLPFAVAARELDGMLAKAPVEQHSFNGSSQAEEVPFSFAFTQLPAAEQAGDLGLALLEVSAGPAASALHLDVVRGADGDLSLRIVHDTATVSPRQTARLAEQLASIVRAVVRDPLTPIDDLGTADPAETARVLANGVGTPRPDVRAEPAHRAFERCAASRPEALAVVCAGKRLSYRDVDVRANRLAHALRLRGVGPDVPVALVVERSVEYVVALLGVLKAGGAFIPVDPASPAARLTQMMDDARPAVIVTHRGLVAPSTVAETPLVDLALDKDLASMPDTHLQVGVHPDNLAYIIFTSGSTGRPKGVAVSHRAITGYVEGVLPELALPEDAVLGTLATTAADLGHTAVFGALCTGRSLYLAAPDETLAPDLLVRRFREQPVDALKIVPSHLAALLEAPDAADLLPTSCLVLGGESVTTPLIDRVLRLRPGLRVINHYGPTETAVGALVRPWAKGSSGPVPIGHPLSGYRAYVLDGKLRPVLEGAPGELYLAGPGVARGYWGQPGETAGRFLPDPFADVPGTRMYRTGDLVRQQPDGAMVFLGRADHQVKIRGNRVEVGEIETVLRSDERITDAVVVPRDEDGDRYLLAYVVPRRSAHAEPAELGERLRTRLPEYMVPRDIVVLRTLPLTPNGKVDRGALPVPDPAATSMRRHVAPRTETESLLVQIWEDILGSQKIGVHDDFFRELGGNSLSATRVVARLRANTHVALHVSTMFETPTVAKLAELIDAERSAGNTDNDPIQRAELTGPVELSPAQRRLWVLSEVDDANAAYNIPAAIRISGALDVETLVRALQEVVHRHEALRTNFVRVDAAPVQIIREVRALSVPVVDVDAPEVVQRAREHAARPFNLERDHLFRATVLRVTPHEHVLLLCLHHTVSDGWSTAVLWREVTTLYTAFRAGDESPLEPLPIQYADFAVWQNKWLEGGAVRPQVEYWTQQLRGLPALLEMPTDRPRPAIQGVEGADLTITVGPDTVAALRELAAERNCTMFMALLAAFNVLLSRYSGQYDIAVGTPVANRTRHETEALIGCFFNTLVIRTDLSGAPSFTELLERVRDVTLAAQTHQDLPFERLVETLNPPRNPGHTPLFQALFVYQSAPGQGLDMDGLGMEQLSLPGSVAKYDLTFDLVEDENGLSGRIEYRTDLFDAETIERLARHYTTLLRSVVRDPAARIGDLDIMDELERTLVLAQGIENYDAGTQGSFVADAFEQQAKSTPDATALVHGSRSLTYSELDRAANRLAHRLRHHGVTENTFVGLLTERSVEMVVAMLAVLKAGGAYVPLDPGAPAARTAYVIDDAGLRVVIAPAARRGELPEEVELIDPEAADVADDDYESTRELRPEHPAYVIYTSGSTGHPKGVVVAQRNLTSFFAAMDRRFGDGVPGTWLALTHYTFDISVLELLWTLTRGFHVVLTGEELVLSDATKPVRADAMEFSLFYFASDSGGHDPDRYRLLMEGARWADEHGFTAVWTPERHFATFGGLYPNPGITGAAVAASTRRIGIRTGSLVLPLHSPLRVAEDWAMIDNLSNGRVGLSVAPGWQPHDFALAPEKFADRKEIMFRDLETVRKLWRGESVRMVSGTGEEVEVRTLPRPVQSELPVWITTAGNPETFQRAGAMGVNVLTHLLGQSVEELAQKLVIYRDAWRKAGHAGEGHVTLMLHTFVSDDEEFVRRTVREPFKAYLGESVDLIRPIARSRGLDPEDIDEADIDALLDLGFDRYYENSGLFGTPQQCAAVVGRLKEAGVDEVACLLDFGIATEEVLNNLGHLGDLQRIASHTEGSATGGSLAVDDVPGDIASLVKRHKVTHLQCTPSLAALILSDDLARASLQELDWMLVGGEALQPAMARTLSAGVGGQVLNVYGPTEATIWSTSHLVTGLDASIGRPLANTRVYILDEQLKPVPVGVPGELFIGGDGVASGYLKRPELTRERFLQDPFVPDRAARMYRTGDVVRCRPSGELDFVGRRDHQVKINGFRVELGEVEAALGDAPGVTASVVVMGDDGRGGQRLIAYVVAMGTLDLAGVRRHLEARLPRHMVPALFVELEAVPLLPSGKADRKALPVPPTAESTHGDEYVAPRTSAEERLAEIWSQLLRVPTVGANDNFFQLGGDSIVAIQMVSRAKRVGLAFSARDLFRHQTLAELAAIANEGTWTKAEQGLVLGEVGLAPVQHWFFEQGLTDPQHYNQAVLVDVNGDKLDVGLLGRACDAVIRHHDGLRNRFVRGADRLRQQVAAPEEGLRVRRLDLADVPASSWASEIATVQAEAHRSLDLEHGPLLRMVYFDFGGRRADQLFTVIHHTVVDGISWRILMEDLQTAYEALRDGHDVLLPPKTVSYKEWTARLRALADADETLAELGYWAGQVEPATELLPRDYNGQNTEATAHTIEVELSVQETSMLLRNVQPVLKADVHDVLLCALAEACEPWTGSQSLLVDVEGHGREGHFEHVDVSRTVGWFTAIYPLRLDLAEEESGLRAVREQVRRIPRHGISFGLLRHLATDASVRGRLARGCEAEIIFNYLGQADASWLPGSMFTLSRESVGASHSPDQLRAHLLNVNAIVADGQLRVTFTFSEAVHDAVTIKALAARFTASVRQVLGDCRAGHVRLVASDFPDIDLTQDELDGLLQEIES